MVFLYSLAKIFGRLLQKIEVLSLHRPHFWGSGAINLILFKSIPYEKLHFASFLDPFIRGGEHKVSSSRVIHWLCSLSFASSHVVWGRQLSIYCSGRDLCQNLCFHSSGESGISAVKVFGVV